MSTAFTEAGNIPVNEAVPVVTYSPIVLEVPGRPVPLEVKVSVPGTGADLPIILLSHGHGGANFLSSFNGYGPLANFWAAHGFAVIQPTHLDSTALGLRDENLPDAPLFWRDRATDMKFVLDHLDDIEAAVPGLAGRLDHDRIVAAGHSLGGHTVSLLLGMQVLDPADDCPSPALLARVARRPWAWRRPSSASPDADRRASPSHRRSTGPARSRWAWVSVSQCATIETQTSPTRASRLASSSPDPASATSTSARW